MEWVNCTASAITSLNTDLGMCYTFNGDANNVYNSINTGSSTDYVVNRSSQIYS